MGWVVNATPQPFYLLLRRITPGIGDWVGPRESDWVWKIGPPPGFKPQTVQFVASRYTDCTILANNNNNKNNYNDDNNNNNNNSSNSSSRKTISSSVGVQAHQQH